jgi:hypothetical protein
MIGVLRLFGGYSALEERRLRWAVMDVAELCHWYTLCSA